VIGVDRVHARGDLLAKRLQLYAGDSASKIDFSDTSAPINASIWYQIGDPVDITRRSWDKVADAIRTWVYSYERPEERVAHLVDGELRPLFQRMTIEQANQDRDSVADIVMQAIVPEMSKLGAYTPSDKKRLVIEDIVVSDDVIKLRETALRGMKRAEEIENEAAGYWRAIKTIQDNLKVSVDDARRIYETQRGLDTIGKTKPNLTLIGKDFGGVLGTINLGDKH
jgi:hypothetical protein